MENSLGYQTQYVFWRAIQKYGWDNIQHEIVAENLSHDEACDLEIELIAKYKTNNPKYGYNQTSGGDGTFNYSHKNPHDDEWKRKISIANTGKKRTDEAKQKMRDAKLGIHWSEERKLAYSIAQKERKFKPSDDCIKAGAIARSIPIDVFSISNEYIGTYKTLSEASNKLGISVSYLSLCLKGKFKNPKYIVKRRNK